jgi:hypothetical protein
MHGTTLYKWTVDCWHTLGHDDRRAVSRDHTILDHTEINIIPSSRQDCRRRLNVRAPQVEVRCC